MNVQKSRFTMLSCIALPALALALVGCGAKLNMDSVQKAISDGLRTQTGLADVPVTCPQESRDAKAGDTFECTAKPKEGGQLAIKVTQKDDKGNFDWEVTKLEGFLDMTKLENGIKQANAGTTVDCGSATQKLRVTKPGDSFECKVSTPDGAAHQFVVQVKDAQGSVDFAPKDAGDQPAAEGEGQGGQGGEEHQ